MRILQPLFDRKERKERKEMFTQKRDEFLTRRREGAKVWKKTPFSKGVDAEGGRGFATNVAWTSEAPSENQKTLFSRKEHKEMFTRKRGGADVTFSTMTSGVIASEAKQSRNIRKKSSSALSYWRLRAKNVIRNEYVKEKVRTGLLRFARNDAICVGKPQSRGREGGGEWEVRSLGVIRNDQRSDANA